MTHTMTERDNMLVVRKFFEVGPSGGDIAAADSLLAPNFSLHVPLPASGSGIQAINEIIMTCRTAFSGLNVTIDDMMADDDRVICRFTARGTHSGVFMGLPPTNKAVSLSGIEIFRMKRGRIAELWGEVNLVGLMQQLGILQVSA
jgi:steroid delta-isomerase-like uncharacterized protein